MGSSPNGVLASARHVTIVGHNSQIVPTVGFFVGGGMSVLVYTTQRGLEADLAPYPGVHVTVLPSYEHAPSGLLEPPYVVAVDHDDDALLIRSWLPPTTAVFLARTEQRRRGPLHGFLSLMPSTTTLRRSLLRRLTVLKRVDLLMNLARQAKHPLILMYSNPDPDAIGAAIGLATIWRAADRDPLIRYTGEVQRYQNKLLLQYLKEEPIEHLKDEELAEADLIAVVDAQPGFWRDDPPKAHVVIDHHPRREDTQALYVDLREGYGSTSSILTEYLVEADLPISKHLATALMYGLTTDTDDLNRHTGAADIRAFDELYPRADHHFLTRLDKAQVPMSVLDHIAWGISHRVVVRDLILIHFGEVPTADIMVQTADQLLLTYGINWTVCAGVKDHTLIVIFRGDGHRQDVGKRAALAFGKIGSAGGHRTMGRAEIPLGDEANELDSCEILVDNLFRKMSAKRRARFVRKLKSHLKGEGPDDHEEFEFAT